MAHFASKILPRAVRAKHAVPELEINGKTFFKYMFLPALGFGGKYMAGDAIAQSLNDQKFSLKRNLQWGAFGLGMSLAFYSPLWIRTYPKYINRFRYGNIGVAAFQTWIFEPFIFMPCFYWASAIFNSEFESDLTLNIFQKWKENFVTDFKALTCYGVPVFGLNATVIPVKYRSWFVTICGIFFSAFIIYAKVDKVTTEDIILPRNAMPYLFEYVPVLFDLHYYSKDREELLELVKTKGGLTLDDFTEYCKRTYPTWHEDCIKRVFDSMDLDRSGTIEFVEITIYFETAKHLVSNRSKLIRWFDSISNQKDGAISKEFFCAELQKWFNDDYAVKLVEQMDTELNGKISRQEFLHFLDHQLSTYGCNNVE